MSSEAVRDHRRGIGSGLAFIVAGPSGAGKNSVIERVMADKTVLVISIA